MTTSDLELALELAARADAITTAAFARTDLMVETKADRTPVSEADRAVEQALREVLAQVRPSDRVVGEEYGDTGSGRRRWIVDPIDGTKNFVRRNPAWATLIALEEDGVVTTGVVSAPALGRRWWASRGHGAWIDDGSTRPIHVSSVRDLADAHISAGSLAAWADWGGPGVYLDLAAQVYADRSFGDFWSHMLVAEGVCEVGLDPIVSLWDLAALQVIVEEAGGKFTNFAGEARVDGGSAISSNGCFHDQVRSILTRNMR